MSLNIKKIGKQGPNRVEQSVIEADVYRARLVQIIDLGLQAQRPFQGKDKPPAAELMLTYELVDEFMKDEEGNDVEDKPRWVSETLPFYGLFADKAKSTQRYNVFDPKGDWDGDFTQALGMAINLTIVNNAKGDKVYTNVGNVAAMSEKKVAVCPDLCNPTTAFDLDDPDMAVFEKLPEWIQKKIVENLNFKGSVLEGKINGDALVKEKPADKPKKAKLAPELEDDEDSNPY
jgi:hypothetical protein